VGCHRGFVVKPAFTPIRRETRVEAPSQPMKLLQIFLPLYNNQGLPFPKAIFDKIREDLAKRFGGVTAFVRSPAVGVWENDAGAVCHDDVVLFEVIVDAVDRDWWSSYRGKLERQFSQDSILIHATDIEIL
jgi:hypothetical protein